MQILPQQSSNPSLRPPPPPSPFPSPRPQTSGQQLGSSQAVDSRWSARAIAAGRTSFVNHESTLAGFTFPACDDRGRTFAPCFTRATTVDPDTGLAVEWLSVQFGSTLSAPLARAGAAQGLGGAPGIAAPSHPPVDISLVLDISGSMGSSFNNDGAAAAGSKLDVAKECIKAIIARLDPGRDRVSVVLFNHSQKILLPLQPAGAINQTFFDALENLRPCGGTSLAAGLAAGAETIDRAEAPGGTAGGTAGGRGGGRVKVEAKVKQEGTPGSGAGGGKRRSNRGGRGGANTDADAAADAPRFRRVMFLTDMQSGNHDEQECLAACKVRAISKECPSYTTLVGIGVDVSAGTVQALSSMPGCMYMSVDSAAEFKDSIVKDFSFDVAPHALGDEQLDQPHERGLLRVGVGVRARVRAWVRVRRYATSS